MKIKELLADQEMQISPTLESIMAKAIKEVYPHGYESCRRNHWDDAHIVYHFTTIDLPEDDINKIILLTARYSKIWTFS